MTFQLVHTEPWTPAGETEDDYREQDVKCWKYLYDTFLPARGWTVGFRDGEDATSDYRIFQRNFTDLYTGSPDKHYLWASRPLPEATNTQWYVYEDANYNVTPGDKGTDSTNRRDFKYRDTYWNGVFSTSDWKFWVSDINNRSFIVTRADYIIFWDLGNDWGTWRPGTQVTQSPGTDRWDTCVFPGDYSGMHMTNLPVNSNTSSTESAVYFGGGFERYQGTANKCLSDKVYTKYTTTQLDCYVVQQDDIKFYSPVESDRDADNWEYPNMVSTAYGGQFTLVKINDDKYWVFPISGTTPVGQFVLDFGTALPDFT